MAANLSVVQRSRLVDSPLRDQPLLAFSKNGPCLVGQVADHYEISFDDATRNILVLGGTGRGKTESVMLPAGTRLIGSGCTGLVLDAKSELVRLAELFPEDTVVIGPGSGNRVNLIGGVELGTFRAIVENIQAKFHQSEKYWGSLGVEDALLIFLYVRETGIDPTLQDIHWGLTNPIAFCLKLERFLRTKAKVSQELLAQIHSREGDEFGLLRLGGFQGNESESGRAREQYSWQTNAIVKTLSVVASNPLLAESFCVRGAPSVSHLIHDKRKSLILDMNADLFPDAAYTVARMLKLQFMRSITIRHGDRSSQKSTRNNYTFMLIDEYQQYINASTQEQSDALRDDNTWFDRSRGYGHINIVATQSLSSLYAQVNESAANTIVQNAQNTIILPTTDEPTLRRADLLVGPYIEEEMVKAKLTNPGSIGEGFVHIANCRAAGGGAVAGHMRAGSIVDAKYAFMNSFIGSGTAKRTAQTSHDKGTLTTNPYSRSLPEKCTGRLHVLINRSHWRTEKWLEGLTSHHRVSFVGVIDYLTQRSLPWDIRGSYDDYAEIASSGDVLVVPNFDDSRQTGVLKAQQCVELIQGLREAGAMVLFGKPSEKLIELERLADAVTEDPIELVTLVHRLLESGPVGEAGRELY